jgi:hypothetical protein
VTYVGLGLFGLILLIMSLYDLHQAVVSRLPLLLISCAVLLSLGIGFMYVMLALHQRRNWARHAAVSFWLLCLIWTAFTIVRNGLHPQPAPGPLQYSNAEQGRRVRPCDLLAANTSSEWPTMVSEALVKCYGVSGPGLTSLPRLPTELWDSRSGDVGFEVVFSLCGRSAAATRNRS